MNMEIENILVHKNPQTHFTTLEMDQVSISNWE